MTETEPFYFWENVSMRNFSFYVRLCSGGALASLAIGIPLALEVQAQSSQLAYEYEDGSFTATAEINPLAGRLLGRVLQQEIPSAVSFSATELAGAFTLPEATAELGNGSITLDSSPVKTLLEPYLQQAMGRVVQRYSLPENIGIETLESMLNYRIVGEGLINSANDSTAFTFEYGDGTDRLSIQGIDPAVLALCQVQECNTQVDGDFDLKLDVEGFSDTSDELGIQLPATVKRALKRAQLFGFKEVAFADGQLTSVVQVLPSLMPPAAEVVPEAPDAAEAIEAETAEIDAIIVPSPEASAAEPVTSPPAAPTPIVAPAPVTPESVPQIAPEALAPVQTTPVQTAPAQALQVRPRRAAASRQAHRLTRGNFVLTAERLTAPWSMVFVVPAR